MTLRPGNALVWVHSSDASRCLVCMTMHRYSHPATLQDFQARMQRCVQRCQDEVQETLSTQPSEREIAKAQVRPSAFLWHF